MTWRQILYRLLFGNKRRLAPRDPPLTAALEARLRQILEGRDQA